MAAIAEMAIQVFSSVASDSKESPNPSVGLPDAYTSEL
jgi:hypothetical protein